MDASRIPGCRRVAQEDLKRQTMSAAGEGGSAGGGWRVRTYRCFDIFTTQFKCAENTNTLRVCTHLKN